MEKTIKIGTKEVRLCNNIGWTFSYRDQFGTDIIPTLMPLAKSLLDLFVGMIEQVGKTEDLTIEDVAKIAGSDKMMDALITLSGIELVDIINITWALAKTANEDIDEPKKWVMAFEEFPLDEVIPAVFELILRGVVSSKNWERLQTKMRVLKPQSPSTTSSSQDSTED